MIQPYTYVDVADNTGAKGARIIMVLKGSSPRGRFLRKTGTIGDTVVATVRKALPGGDAKDGDVVRGVIVRCKQATRRADGSYVRFDRNAIVLIDPQLNPRGTRIFGPVPRELRAKNFMKILSLAAEVV